MDLPFCRVRVLLAMELIIDEDGLTDESQENWIDDDHDWRSFDDENGNGVWDWEDLNNNGKLDEGEDLNGDGVLDIEDLRDDVGVDGLGPLDQDWPGLGVDPLEGNGQAETYQNRISNIRIILKLIRLV